MNGFKGKVIGITRPAERTQEAVDFISANGGKSIVAPTLELRISNSDSLVKLCRMAEKLDWLIFTSPTAIISLFKHCPNLNDKLSADCKIAVIGPRTGKFLTEYGLNADIIPDNYTAEGLLDILMDQDMKNKTVGIPRTMVARDVLPEGLKKQGANVYLADAYKSSIPEDKTKVQNLIKLIINGKVDAVTFTSPLTVNNFFEIAGNSQRDDLINILKSGKVLVAAIGPVTSKPLKERGITPIIPEKYTVKAMLTELMKKI
ncbi:MAG: uroporphyrinogen-III synthase [Methanobacteriaceae archaeon]|nr:uroporphyrinogen-III synthase [Methanobacteriaceae archaeon]